MTNQKTLKEAIEEFGRMYSRESGTVKVGLVPGGQERVLLCAIGAMNKSFAKDLGLPPETQGIFARWISAEGIPDKIDSGTSKIDIGNFPETFQGYQVYYQEGSVIRKQAVYGALAPPALAWQMGKTAGSIQFVGRCERYLAEVKPEPHERGILERAIEQVKAGILVIETHLTVEQYLLKAPK